MPIPSETSEIISISSLISGAEKATYDELIASTIRRSTWFMAHIGLFQGIVTPPLSRYDIAIGEVGEEIDLLPDLGYALTGGTGVTGSSHVTTSFPFVIPQGVRVSIRIRSPSSTGQEFFVAVRLIQ